MPEPVTLSQVKPYYGRISVLPSPVDEEQRTSGLIVPFELGDVIRAVVLAIDVVEGEPSEEYVAARIKVGSIVYFRGGIKLGDMYFIQSPDIIAYEEAE